MVPGLCSLGLQGSGTAGNSGYKRGNDEVPPHSAPQVSSGCLGLYPVPAAGAAPAAAPAGGCAGTSPVPLLGELHAGLPQAGFHSRGCQKPAGL